MRAFSYRRSLHILHQQHKAQMTPKQQIKPVDNTKKQNNIETII